MEFITMDSEQVGGVVLGSDGPITRAKFEVNTSAKGDVNVSFTIEVQVNTGESGLWDGLDRLETDAVERAARIKRDYIAEMGDAS